MYRKQAPQFHPKGCHPAVSTQDEITEARATLVSKVDILIYPIHVKRETHFACYQISIADDDTIDGSNEIPVLYFFHRKGETWPCMIQ